MTTIIDLHSPSNSRTNGAALALRESPSSAIEVARRNIDEASRIDDPDVRRRLYADVVRDLNGLARDVKDEGTLKAIDGALKDAIKGHTKATAEKKSLARK